MTPRHNKIVERALTRLKLKQLRLLVMVGKHGNIQAAARELNVSQPAATKMIKDLELDFDVQLFERTNRGVIATVFGEALIRHGKLIFAQISIAAQEMDDLSEGNSGRVVVGTLLAASSYLLPKAIELVLRSRPNVTIKIVEGTNEVLMPGLRSGEIDLVVGRLSTHRHRKELSQLALFQEEIQLIVRCGHPLCERENVQFDDLREYGWILPPVDTTLRRQVDQFFIQQDQYTPPAIVESVSYLTNRTLLSSSDLISLMPSHVASQDIALGTLRRMPFSLPFGTGPVGVTFRSKEQLSPVGQMFLATLSDVSGAMQ